MLAGPNDRSDVEKGGKSKALKKLPYYYHVLGICWYKGPFTIQVLVV